MDGVSASHIQSLSSRAPLMLLERHHFAFSRPHSLRGSADLSMSPPISKLWLGDCSSFTLNFTHSRQTGWLLSRPFLRKVPFLSVLYRKHWVVSPHPGQALPLDSEPQPDTQPSCALRVVFGYQMLTHFHCVNRNSEAGKSYC